jgi:hypothetical protein
MCATLEYVIAFAFRRCGFACALAAPAGDHYYNETLTLDRGKRSKHEFYRRSKGLVVCAENHWHYE